MCNKYYKTGIDREKQCINVFVNDPSFMNVTKGILLNLYYANVKDSYSRVDQSTKIIEVSSKEKINLQDFEKAVQSRLDEVDDEIFIMREKLLNMKLYDAQNKYDEVILKMMNGEYDSELFNDMYMIMGILIGELTNINIISLIKQNERAIVREDKSEADFHTQTQPLFCATNALIERVNELNLIKLQSISKSKQNSIPKQK